MGGAGAGAALTDELGGRVSAAESAAASDAVEPPATTTEQAVGAAPARAPPSRAPPSGISALTRTASSAHRTAPATTRKRPAISTVECSQRGIKHHFGGALGRVI